MSRFTKIIAAIAMTATVATLVVAPAKADAASDALDANAKWLASIAKENEAAQKAVEEAALKGLKLAEARQAEINAAAQAGMTSGQALLEKSTVTRNAANKSVDAAALKGMQLAEARQAEIRAAAASGMAAGQALLNDIQAQTAASAAWVQAASASGR